MAGLTYWNRLFPAAQVNVPGKNKHFSGAAGDKEFEAINMNILIVKTWSNMELFYDKHPSEEMAAKAVKGKYLETHAGEDGVSAAADQAATAARTAWVNVFKDFHPLMRLAVVCVLRVRLRACVCRSRCSC